MWVRGEEVRLRWYHPTLTDVSLTRWAWFLYGDRDATNQEEGSGRKGSWASAVQQRLREGSGRLCAGTGGWHERNAGLPCARVLEDMRPGECSRGRPVNEPLVPLHLAAQILWVDGIRGIVLCRHTRMFWRAAGGRGYPR
jgi:hypothetical protein